MVMDKYISLRILSYILLENETEPIEGKELILSVY